MASIRHTGGGRQRRLVRRRRARDFVDSKNIGDNDDAVRIHCQSKKKKKKTDEFLCF
jgi:hypothetical protein